ncbi:MAG: hypothetical protein JW741_05630 [Sedimentisphaerales bacterium]|nr:hypothetical protein [Sedimentisphaerales bacterium]
MRKTVVAGAILALSAVTGRAADPCCAPTEAGCCSAQADAAETVETILRKLQKKAAELTSYQCRLDYVFRQPLLESQTRQKGTLQYAKFDDRSYLRIDFRTMQQDEEAEQSYRQQFLFDGVWLWHIDYQIKNAEGRQITEPNQPADAFALASRRVPVLGFSRIEELEKQFAIELVKPEQAETAPYHHLHMKVLPESVYKEDYVTIDFWIDRKLTLPAKVTAVTTEQDVCEIKLLEPRVNQDIAKATFAVKVPDDFAVQTVPLERNR